MSATQKKKTHGKVRRDSKETCCVRKAASRMFSDSDGVLWSANYEDVTCRRCLDVLSARGTFS